MIDLLLKQLGLSPASIKKQVDDAAQNFASVVKHFDARFDKLEKMIKENGLSSQDKENASGKDLSANRQSENNDGEEFVKESEN